MRQDVFNHAQLFSDDFLLIIDTKLQSKTNPDSERQPYGTAVQILPIDKISLPAAYNNASVQVAISRGRMVYDRGCNSRQHHKFNSQPVTVKGVEI